MLQTYRKTQLSNDNHEQNVSRFDINFPVFYFEHLKKILECNQNLLLFLLLQRTCMHHSNAYLYYFMFSEIFPERSYLLVALFHPSMLVDVLHLF